VTQKTIPSFDLLECTEEEGETSTWWDEKQHGAW